jgi:chromosome segregation ATPase
MMNRDDVRYRLLENKVERLKEEICSYEQSIRNLLDLLGKNMKAFDELDAKLILLIDENEELRNRLKMKGDK